MYSESTNRLLPDSKIFSSIVNLMTVHPALRQTINDSVSYSDFLQNLKSMALSFLSMNSAIGALLSAGWPVTNQQIFITAAARRGQYAKL